LRKAGVVIKTWSPALLDAFQNQTQIVLKELADQDPDFAAAWANLREFTAQSTAWHFLSKLP
jgi:TRAP-type mannitol/chloroaromatic compound transport system substrate-binding protein